MLAESIRRNKQAINATFELPWNQGQTDGQVNQLMLLKRQMHRGMQGRTASSALPRPSRALKG